MTGEMTNQLIISINNLNLLTEEVIEHNIKQFLCDDSDSNFDNNIILTSPDFLPDSFTIFDRLRSNQLYLAHDENNGDTWLKLLIQNELERLVTEGFLVVEYPDKVLDLCAQQVHKFLNYQLGKKPISSHIFNQEAPDVIKRVLSYLFFADPLHPLPTHKSFNAFGWKVIPSLIEKRLWKKGYTCKQLLLFSIASGLVGLDIKGGIAAASKLSDIAIPIKQLMMDDQDTIQEALWNRLCQCTSKGLLVDYWDDFSRLALIGKCNLVWFLDDYIESFFDILLLQEMLETNHLLNVTIVPRNGYYGNDMGYTDTLHALELNMFSMLKEYVASGRLNISQKGPSMGTINLRKLSKAVVNIVAESDCIVIKGCRAHELIQGGINKESYTAYVVAREFSESETGFDARQAPLLFFNSKPGEYSYWGFKGRAKRTKKIDDNKFLNICYSTLEEHERRKQLTEPQDFIKELTNLIDYEHDTLLQEYKIPLHREINLLMDKLIEFTCVTYNSMAQEYKTLRKDEPHETDIQLFNKLLQMARKLVKEGLIGNSDKSMNLLDVGTGSGRDLRYFHNFTDIHAIGIDNSDTFISILDELARIGDIPANSYYKMDMRDLSFKDCSFDIVRQNATLLHLPLVAPGIGVDCAIAESYRVLKPFGLLFVNVKAGNGMEYVDTKEGLGGRFFQFFTEESLTRLLTRNNFNIIEMVTWFEERPSGRVYWYVAFAQKPGA